MTRLAWHLAFCLVAPFALGACKSIEPPAPPPQVIIVRVSSDPGRPLADANLLFNGKKVATTGADGVGQLKLVGRDGEAFDVSVQCPQGYESPTKPVNVMLKRLADPTKSPEYSVTCPPTNRTIVVAVRAVNGPNLPVVYLGREIARTDSSGAAHVMFKVEPGEQLSLTLDTSADAVKDLRPQSPTATFAVSHQDDVVVMEQKFDKEKPKFRGGPRGPAKPRGPTKIGG